jgi:hypothetical protein
MSQAFAPTSRSTEARLDQACAIVAQDSRADDRRREVVVSRDRVTIDRNFRGIAMRLSIPVESYQGVCVALRSGRSGGTSYQIRLAHRDAELSVPLAEAADDREIWADWRSWARFFNLPALIERNDGLAVWGRSPGLASTKRRLKRRRAPFLARRFAAPRLAGIVHCDPEIIARD